MKALGLTLLTISLFSFSTIANAQNYARAYVQQRVYGGGHRVYPTYNYGYNRSATVRFNYQVYGPRLYNYGGRRYFYRVPVSTSLDRPYRFRSGNIRVNVYYPGRR